MTTEQQRVRTELAKQAEAEKRARGWMAVQEIARRSVEGSGVPHREREHTVELVVRIPTFGKPDHDLKLAREVARKLYHTIGHHVKAYTGSTEVTYDPVAEAEEKKRLYPEAGESREQEQ